MVTEHEAGRGSINRSRNWQGENRRKEKTRIRTRAIVCKNHLTGTCNDQECFVCTTGGPGSCKQPDFEEVGGKQTRPGRSWSAIYHGQTGYSAKVRGGGHQNDQRANKTSNGMIRHNNIYHRSQTVQYQMSVVSLHKEPVGRLLREGVDIVAGNQTILLNSKEEFLQGAVPSTRTQRGFGS